MTDGPNCPDCDTYHPDTACPAFEGWGQEDLCAVCKKNKHVDIPLVGGGNACANCGLEITTQMQKEADSVAKLRTDLRFAREDNEILRKGVLSFEESLKEAQERVEKYRQALVDIAYKVCTCPARHDRWARQNEPGCAASDASGHAKKVLEEKP